LIYVGSKDVLATTEQQRYAVEIKLEELLNVGEETPQIQEMGRNVLFC